MLTLLAALPFGASFLATLAPRPVAAQIVLPAADPRDSVEVRAAEASRWRQGSEEVLLLSAGVEIVQGDTTARAAQGVLWLERESAGSARPSRVVAYLEGDVRVEVKSRAPSDVAAGKTTQSLRDRTWLGRFHTWNEIEVRIPVATGRPQQPPPVWERAARARESADPGPVRPAQFVQPGISQPGFSQPGAAPPEFAQPGFSQPGFVQPGFAQPGAPPPGAFVPGPGIGPGVGQPALNGPGYGQPGAGAPLFAPPGFPQGPFGSPDGEPGLPPGVIAGSVNAQPLGAQPMPGQPFGMQPGAGQPGGAVPSGGPTAGIKKIESRTSGGFDAKTFNGPDGKTAGFVINSGVRLVFDAIDNVQFQDYAVRRIDIETDRVVVWGDMPKLSLGDSPAAAAPTTSRPLEVYLEGNIVFREGDRVIYAQRMYYNVTYRFGVVLGAEMLTPVPEYKGLVRLKADALQMFNQQHFQAYGAALTTSRLGVPRYWFQADAVELRDQPRTKLDPTTRLPVADPVTGEVRVDHHYMASSRDNWVFVGGVPVFYWPTLTTDLTEPSYYLDRVQVKNDNVLGTQLLLDWDLYQLLGIRNRPDGTQWQLSTDVLSERGFAAGTLFRYQGDTLLGLPGPYKGSFDAWGLRDAGLDNLGIDRRSLTPESDWRGRLVWQHRQRFSNGYQFTGELGLLSDRNFMEQFFEREWDQNKDLTTGLELKQLDDNMTWALSADARVNPFFTQTEWLPRFDHYWLGQSFLSNIFTISEHTQVGYAHVRPASAPKDPADLAKFELLPWEADREGLRSASRMELDLPVELGPVKFVPYVLGEAAYWGEDLSGGDLTRLFGQAGLRTSLPIWRADPGIQSELFNLNGLAHKITLEGEVFVADANRDMSQLPLYDAIDDDALEHFRRRLKFNTFDLPLAIAVPLKFDPRYYALRSGLQNWVTSPSTEIADDLAVARIGVNQRWQTKRGLPGRQRIVDWIVFDVQASLFPNASRDNFGESAGLIEYDFRWHVGDRLTLLSDGYADVFGEGLRTMSVGGLISRPDRGSLYLGFRTIEGPGPLSALTPVHSNVLTAAINYRMSEKWILGGATSYDFSPSGNHGQNLSLTRIGESFLVKAGFNYDLSRDNFGATLVIEPRFLPSGRLGRVAGVPIPPAGVDGLE